MENIDIEKILKFRNQNNAFGKLIGVETITLEQGHAIVRINIKKEFLNPNNSVHGGILFSLADTAAGDAATSYGDRVATLNSSFHFLRPALDTKVLVAEAIEIKHGKRAMVFRVDVKNENETLIATGNFTYMSLGVKINLDEID